MRPAALVDAGFMVALLHSSDERHPLCVRVFQNTMLPLLTSEAVLTELFFLLASRRIQPAGAWRFVRSGAITLASIATSDLPEIQELMVRYDDRPMDFADATLVHLAQRESLSTVLTVDHDDFEAYRIGGRKRFTILPERPR
jgi:predicted nucleic acid-binding protein